MLTVRVLTALILIGFCLVVYALWGGDVYDVATSPAMPVHTIPVTQLERSGPVKDIQLQYHQPDLPPGPGRDQFATQCVICHSPRYIINQPIFPRKTWTAEVHKMVAAYGAMITPDQEEEIVNYLVYWHGQEDPSAGSAQGH
jgi:sulfite dehydrogenase (cytochrome) subunit B